MNDIDEQAPTLADRVADLEAERLRTLASFTRITGLLRRMTAAELAREDGWIAVLESPEFRTLILTGAVPDTDKATDAAPDTDVPQVSRLACLKCGSSDVDLRYCDSSSYRTTVHADDECRMCDPEHFHRACRRCRYAWRTDDVLTGRSA